MRSQLVMMIITNKEQNLSAGDTALCQWDGHTDIKKVTVITVYRCFIIRLVTYVTSTHIYFTALNILFPIHTDVLKILHTVSMATHKFGT